MNDKQKAAVKVALDGHNLSLLGSAGTGKSHMLKEISKALKSQGKRVQITCSTGIAWTVYEHIDKACTVHQFLGLLDGRYMPSEILNIHKNIAKFNYVRTNLENTDCLVIDECSMISARLFETIIRVCSSKPNGPLQLIFCWDFFQLPHSPSHLVHFWRA